MAAVIEKKCPKCPPKGLAPWMATFADLMALLMCFFVLLLAFSEMDVLRFKQIAGSMKFAFGVQNKIEVTDIPRGTSVIAQEFRPGRPEPTPIETIQQQTLDMTQQALEFQAGEDSEQGGDSRDQGGETTFEESNSSMEQRQNMNEDAQELMELMMRLQEQLSEQIDEGALELEQLGQQIIIRVNEQGTFPQGSAFLQPQFRPIIRQIASVIGNIPGEVRISGHTDNRVIRSEMHSSNWDLSSARAVSVAEEMSQANEFDTSRMTVQGFADTRPLVPNNSEDNRRRNRRVEIAILQGEALESAPIDAVTDQ
ncbi:MULTISPECIES: flagellar motor protein MotB [Gammaproteobacteria]|uniref:flagellar motor protein MotB n=1 Tax=Gammaproteobacteria TaxID=1236 RepID=UPI000DCFF3ED|nr:MULTISPECIES: flagellar motor protein MotB [Gammaproteobacteria]RTE85552.1 flagellar motor protein MotB [Aliidiomarina sp. B3213]TCZ89522.1 flagellar motor protein MotB [Lysobacter sp. N42]